MKSNGSVWNGWRFAVDVLVAAAAFLLVFAAIDASADSLQALLIPIALIGGALALEPLEPGVTTQPPSTDLDARSIRIPAGIVDATSA